LKRFRAKWIPVREENASKQECRAMVRSEGSRIRQRPRQGGRYPSVQSAERGSAVIVAGRNARDVGTIEADVGEFAIAQLGQLVDVALIIPERLDHADEREQHG